MLSIHAGKDFKWQGGRARSHSAGFSGEGCSSCIPFHAHVHMLVSFTLDEFCNLHAREK
jgi:hypothetical protein